MCVYHLHETMQLQHSAKPHLSMTMKLNVKVCMSLLTTRYKTFLDVLSLQILIQLRYLKKDLVTIHSSFIQTVIGY